MPVTPYFLTSYFCIPVTYNEKDIFLGVLVLEGLIGLHRTVQLQLLQHYWLGHRFIRLLEELMLKLKFQYFGHPMQRADSFEKTLMLGKIEGRRRRGRQRMRWLDGITNSMDMDGFGWTPGVGDGPGSLVCCGSWGRKELYMTE